MTQRKKKGISLIIGGVVTTVVGGILIGTATTPEWVGFAIQLIGTAADVFGFTVVFPDYD